MQTVPAQRRKRRVRPSRFDVPGICRSMVSFDEVHEPSLAADHTFDITTDSGASDAFFDAASDELIYRDHTDTWFKKHGQVFRPMTYVQVQGEAKQFMQLQVATGGFLGPTLSLLSKSKIDNLLTLSRHHFRIDPHLLDEYRNLIGCADGTVL